MNAPARSDRKSTRLNSSHPSNSYAVFCLKKKNVIVTPVGAVPEIVGANGHCAFIVPSGDAVMLAERMTRLAAEPDLLARMAAAAQARVAERFTERSAVQVLDQAYRLTMRRRAILAI